MTFRRHGKSLHKVAYGLAGCLAVLTAVGTWLVGAASAMDPSQPYGLTAPYPQYPPAGPQRAAGIVLWNNGYFGPTVTETPLPPFVIKALVAHGWDALTVDRNPALENGGWLAKGIQHVNNLIQQIANAHQYGYTRIILAGQGYGASIALEAAIRNPVYGIIAAAPSKSNVEKWRADSVQYTLAQLQRIQTSRALFVMSPDDEVMPGFDQAPAARQALDARSMPYIMVDRQVHGYHGVFSEQFWPYANCAISFFSPAVGVPAREFHCYRDELMVLLNAVGETTAGATAIWFGYFDKTGQAVAIIDHRTTAGDSVDCIFGGDLMGKKPAQISRDMPGRWVQGMFSFGSQRNFITVEQVNGIWRVKQDEQKGDWGGTLTLVAAAK